MCKNLHVTMCASFNTSLRVSAAAAVTVRAAAAVRAAGHLQASTGSKEAVEVLSSATKLLQRCCAGAMQQLVRYNHSAVLHRRQQGSGESAGRDEIPCCCQQPSPCLRPCDRV